MDTYFAPALRQTPELLQQELAVISNNEVVDALMKSVSGLLAILDEHRQILAVNDTLLQALGIRDAEEVIGLRPGEAIDCVHAHDEPGGCGTSRYCASCGAAIAIVSSLAHDCPEERLCAAVVDRSGSREEICFQVRATPIHYEDQRFVVLLLQDITGQQSWAAMEKVFFHDISNTLTTLVSATELLVEEYQQDDLVRMAENSALRLKKEIEIHKLLIYSRNGDYQPTMHAVRVDALMRELADFIKNHPAAAGKTLAVSGGAAGETIVTDEVIFLRVLTNMLTNAFEATPPGGEVRLGFARVTGAGNAFYVWNDGEIPEYIRLRIFQRYYSTKGGLGRGLGTASMKMLGEQILGGKVDFSSEAATGTIFRFTLPLQPEHKE